MNKIVWRLAFLTSQGVDPVLGDSSAHTAGHMYVASDQSTKARISNGTKKPQYWRHLDEHDAGLHRQQRFGRLMVWYRSQRC